MRFMIIVKATADSEAGVMPPPSLLAEMGAFHEELARAGVLLDGAGLKASSQGWRVRMGGGVGAGSGAGDRLLVDGPFATNHGLIAGYTLIQVRTRDEAVEWSRRYPNPTLHGTACEIEVRQLFEADDFASDNA